MILEKLPLATKSGDFIQLCFTYGTRDDESDDVHQQGWEFVSVQNGKNDLFQGVGFNSGIIVHQVLFQLLFTQVPFVWRRGQQGVTRQLCSRHLQAASRPDTMILHLERVLAECVVTLLNLSAVRTRSSHEIERRKQAKLDRMHLYFHAARLQNSYTSSSRDVTLPSDSFIKTKQMALFNYRWGSNKLHRWQ